MAFGKESLGRFQRGLIASGGAGVGALSALSVAQLFRRPLPEPQRLHLEWEVMPPFTREMPGVWFAGQQSAWPVIAVIGTERASLEQFVAEGDRAAVAYTDENDMWHVGALPEGSNFFAYGERQELAVAGLKIGHGAVRFTFAVIEGGNEFSPLATHCIAKAPLSVMCRDRYLRSIPIS